MPSDMTNTKRHAFIAEHGDPTAIVACPTCSQPMALDLAHALYAVDAGTLPDNSSLRWAEASHTDPSADGGKRVALECNRCNRTRGKAVWHTDRPTYSVWNRSNAHTREARRSLGELRSRGYVTD